MPGVSGQADSYQQTEKSYAFFTNETYALIEHLDLTAGLRYTHEAKDETANYNSPDGGAACAQLLGAPPPSAALPYSQLLLLDMGAQRHSIRSSPGSRMPSPSARTISTRRSNWPITSRTM